jgi:hypothetical protein
MKLYPSLRYLNPYYGTFCFFALAIALLLYGLFSKMADKLKNKRANAEAVSGNCLVLDQNNSSSLASVKGEVGDVFFYHVVRVVAFFGFS